MTLTVGSLFSGIGGLDLGLERAGMTVRWQVEIDEYCRGILAKHWPHVKRFEDVHECGGHNLERVDVIAGGAPCQPVSLAGRRRGQDDERWLWPEFARIIREVRPRIVILENVPGLFVRGFGDVLRDLAACGFDAEWDCIPAAAFGAPHLRYRVFVVAYAAGSRRFSWRASDAKKRPAISKRRESFRSDSDGCGTFWATKPGICPVAYGIPDRVARLKALGNAVVPQVAEYVGRCVMAAIRKDTP